MICTSKYTTLLLGVVLAIQFNLASAQIFRASLALEALPPVHKSTIDKYIGQYQIINLKTEELNKWVHQTNATGHQPTIVIGDENYKLQLIENEVRAPGYQEVWSGIEQKNTLLEKSCYTFKGYVNDNLKQELRLTITNNILSGFITTPTGRLHLTTIKHFLRDVDSSDRRIIVYKEEHLKEDPHAICQFINIIPKSVKQISSANARIATSCRIAEIATEADIEYFQIYGQNTNDQILGLINEIGYLYENNFNMRLVVVYQEVWTGPGNDPYNVQNGTSAQMIDEFRDWWQIYRSNVNRDLAHLFTGRSFSGGTVGTAYRATACSDPGLSYGVTSIDSRDRAKTFAHETGHNFGAYHPNEDPDGDAEANQCGSHSTASAMCQGVQRNPLYFSQKQLQRVTDYINNNQSCLLDYNNLTINGPSALCSSNTTYSTNAPFGSAPTWTASSNITLNTNTGIIISVNPTGTGSGWIEVSFNAGCAVTYRLNITVGSPQLAYIAVNGQTTSNATICVNNFATVEALPYDANSSYNWSLSNPGNAYLTNYGSANTSFNAYTADCYGLTLQISNACGTTQTGLTICAQNCFSRYTVLPNPAKDYLTVEFDNVDNADALPDEIALLTEVSTKPLKTVNVQEAYSRKTFKNGKQIEVDVRELPRGTYYLYVKNSRRKDKEVDAMRILLE